ncbi:MAG: transporter [Terracidiphilus sp.]
MISSPQRGSAAPSFYSVFLAIVFAAALLFFSPAQALGQDGYFSNWFARVDKTHCEQPHWITPLRTTTPLLEEELRYDQDWLQHVDGYTWDEYDGAKGLELIPWYKVEVILQVPPYYNYNGDSGEHNGAGDVQFLVKYRILSANEQHGNYILTAFLGWSVPTGSYSNGVVTGANSATITPTVAYGKGFGNFDEQGTFGVRIPTAGEQANGTNLVWNNTLQYRVMKKIWPEVEFNTTHYHDGEHAGQTLNYITPGFVLGRFKLAHRVGITFGGGFQIATSHFYRNNHNGIFSVRFPF